MSAPSTPATAPSSSWFHLADSLAAKAAPALVGDDEQHFTRIARSLETAAADVGARLDATRRESGGTGQAAMERDHQVHRLTARLRTLARYGVDLCLGRMVAVDGTITHVGRTGLRAPDGEPLLVDWRSPVAEPFFGATHADPMGLASRRRYTWTLGRVTDYWDEVFDARELERRAGDADLDDQSAFVAGLGASRSDRMRDVLGTIAADQDAVVRAGSRGALVVDGGPGTGKTVVALHRTAYLLYADPRLGHHRGGVLFVGPHRPYLAYVSDVLPSLGEEGVRTCTLRDLVPEGADAVEEADAEVTRLKATAAMVDAIEPAVALYEEPPTTSLLVETEWADVRVTAADWAEAFAAPDPGTPHNEARDEVWDALLDRLVDTVVDATGADDATSVPGLRRALAADERLLDAMGGAWPRLEAADVVGDLLSVPAYLRRCAPWLDADQVRRLQRADPQAWTTSDLPLLDAARHRLGDATAGRRRRRHEADVAAERARVNEVVEHLVASDDSEMQVMSMLRRPDGQQDLVDAAALASSEPDPGGGTTDGVFAHVVVDEAQELTDAEWRMVLRRCPSRSLTVVGDRAQARRGFAESWDERLRRIGVDDVAVATLTVGYRTPSEVMEAAEPVIRAAVPDANVPTSVRSTGVPVTHGSLADLRSTLVDWLGGSDGVGCVVAPSARLDAVRDLVAEVAPDSGRVRLLTPELVKGLEFDLVVLLDPASFGRGVPGAVDRYVAMTRATQRLVVLDADAGGATTDLGPGSP